MVRLLEVGLIGAVCVAVLAFGGTAPSFFAVAQVIILGLGILFVLSGRFFASYLRPHSHHEPSSSARLGSATSLSASRFTGSFVRESAR